MSLTHKQRARLFRRVFAWGDALAQYVIKSEVKLEGLPLQVSVATLAQHYKLDKQEGYNLNPNKGRWPEFTRYVNAQLLEHFKELVVLRYEKANFIVAKKLGPRIEIVEHETDKVIDIVKLQPHNATERMADKIDTGLNINLDHDKYYTRIVLED